MLKKRIEILESGKVIEPQTAVFVKAVIDSLHNDYPEISDDKAVMFITHLAMAAQRIKDKKEENPLGEEIMREIPMHPSYSQACTFLEKIRELSCVELSDTESDFLLVHLCNLFSIEAE